MAYSSPSWLRHPCGGISRLAVTAYPQAVPGPLTVDITVVEWGREIVEESANDRLSKVVAKHEAFLRRYPGGEIADLRNQDLRGVELPGVDLRQALLAGAN